MKRIFLLLVLSSCLIYCEKLDLESEKKEKSKFSPPEWIIGDWKSRNTALILNLVFTKDNIYNSKDQEEFPDYSEYIDGNKYMVTSPDGKRWSVFTKKTSAVMRWGSTLNGGKYFYYTDMYKQ